MRDKLIAGALRAAYLDYLPRDRHAVAVLFIECEPRNVDVNVHPAKAEVRFRDGGLVRGLIVGALRQALEGALHRAATTGGAGALAALRAPARSAGPWDWRASPAASTGFAEPAQQAFEGLAPAAAAAAAQPAPADLAAPLGAARAQVHELYVIAQTIDGIVIVDQHAAHERIVYERLKRQRAQNGVERQILLSPIVVELDADAAARLVDNAATLGELGLVVEAFGPGAVLLREAPALIAKADMSGLMRDLADDLAAEDGALSLERRLDQRLATIACHHSVRARSAPRARRNERAVARNGAHAGRRPVQPRPPDLCRTEARRHRAAVRQEVDELEVRANRSWSLQPRECMIASIENLRHGSLRRFRRARLARRPEI